MRKEPLVNGERYHVFHRGAFKSLIFLDDEDREKLLHNLYRYQCNKSGQRLVKVAVYVLMGNHFHLTLLQIGDEGASKYMHRVCTSYAMYFNSKYNKPGCLLSSRFQVKHIDNDEYFLHLTRYIHQNPLSLQLKQPLEAYRWSSYPTYLNLADSPIITDRLAIYMFANSREYLAFMNAWQPINNPIIKQYMFDEDN